MRIVRRDDIETIGKFKNEEYEEYLTQNQKEPKIALNIKGMDLWERLTKEPLR